MDPGGAPRMPGEPGELVGHLVDQRLALLEPSRAETANLDLSARVGHAPDEIDQIGPVADAQERPAKGAFRVDKLVHDEIAHERKRLTDQGADAVPAQVGAASEIRDLALCAVRMLGDGKQRLGRRLRAVTPGLAAPVAAGRSLGLSEFAEQLAQ